MTTIIVGKRIAITGLEEDEAGAWARLARQPNPEKAKLERLGKWAGNVDDFIKLGYVRPTKDGPMVVLPRGMLQQVWETFGQEATWDVRVASRDTVVEMGGTPVQLREYQRKALDPWWPSSWALPGLPVDGMIHAPCGSGKTEMGIALIQRLSARALVIVHTKDLQRQWAERLDKYGLASNLIGGGSKSARIVGEEPVTVGMVQSLRNRSEELDANAGAFGLVVVDEAHHCAATVWSDVAQRLRSGARLGLTATPKREDGLQPSLEMVMGPIRSVVPSSALEECGARVGFTVERVNTGFCPTEDPQSGFAAALTEITQDLARNDMICNAAQEKVKAGHTVLVLTSRVEHAQELALALDVPALVGKTKDSEREAIIAAMRTGSVRCATATQLADEGLDVPMISCVIMAAPSRAQGKAEQRVGRALRPMEGKPAPVVVDFVDDHGLYVSQWRSRLAAYRRAGMTG